MDLKGFMNLIVYSMNTKFDLETNVSVNPTTIKKNKYLM